MKSSASHHVRPRTFVTLLLIAAALLFGANSSGPGNGQAQPAADKKGPCLVLTCDGGGARGLIAALVIERLEKDVGFLGRVNVFAGTSTGGIIALGLASDQKISSLVSLYQSKGRDIFQPYEPDNFLTIGAIQLGLNALAKRYKPAAIVADSARDVLLVKYDNKGLKKELERLLDPDRQGRTLASLKKQVLVTTLQLQGDAGWAPRALHNLPLQPPSVESGLVEAALCTSAAPLYFPPYKHAKLGYCADGGLFANSPGAVTLASLVRAGHTLDSIRMLSIGNGAAVNHFEVGALPFLEPGEHGIGAWLSPLPRGAKNEIPPFPLIAAIFDATSAADHAVCQQLLTADRYRRAQVQLDEMLPLDAREDADIGKIEEAATKYFTTESYRELKNWVVAKFVR